MGSPAPLPAPSRGRGDPDGCEALRGSVLQRCMNCCENTEGPRERARHHSRTAPPGPCLSALRLPGADVGNLRLHLKDLSHEAPHQTIANAITLLGSPCRYRGSGNVSIQPVLRRSRGEMTMDE